MKFKPIGDIVAVSPELESSTLWTHDHNRRSSSALVLSIGGDVRSVVPGERVFFNRYAGNELNVSGEVILLIHEGEIFAAEARRPSLSDRAES